MVPGKRQRTPVQKLEYVHLMKFEKTNKWRNQIIKKDDNRDRKRVERENKEKNENPPKK